MNMCGRIEMKNTKKRLLDMIKSGMRTVGMCLGDVGSSVKWKLII